MVDEAGRVLHGRVLSQRLLREGREPVDQQRPVGCIGLAHASGGGWDRSYALERKDALGSRLARHRAGLRRPGGGEHLDFRERGDDARELIVDRGGQRFERRVLAWPGENELVRCCPQRGADRGRAVLCEPEPVIRIVRGMVSERARDSEHQVVPRLVGQEQGRRGGQKDGRVRDAANVHPRIV